MTILTKFGSSEKKDQLPLVNENNQNEAKIEEGSEGSVLKYVVVLKKRTRRVSVSSYLCCLFVLALLVVSVGVLGGVLLYRQYGALSAPRYTGWCAIPYDMPSGREPQFRIMSVPDSFLASSRDVELLDEAPRPQDASLDLLSESFDIDGEFERIVVADFRDGRHTNLLHDFTSNMSGIVDSERCFVYPINYKVVMQPDMFVSALQHRSELDYSTVHEVMRAMLPALLDLSSLGQHIGKECAARPTYMLEKQDGGVRKRSAEMPSSAKFAHFSGQHVQEIDVVNIDELLAYEERTTGMV